jgi:hypothetical protein
MNTLEIASALRSRVKGAQGASRLYFYSYTLLPRQSSIRLLLKHILVGGRTWYVINLVQPVKAE